MPTANTMKPGKKQTNALASPAARQSPEQKPSHHHGTTRRTGRMLRLEGVLQDRKQLRAKQISELSEELIRQAI